MRLHVLALVVSALSSPAVAGPCAMRSLSAHPMTVGGTAIPADGGVLVAMDGLGMWDQPSLPSLDKTGWQFVDGATKTAPAVIHLAPGLAVFPLPAGGASIKLDDGKRTLVTVKRGPDVPALPAPAVASIIHPILDRAPGPRETPRNAVVVKLTAAKPATAVAMVIWDDKTALSWAPVAGLDATERAVEIYRATSRCETPIPGMTRPALGSKVTVAWVDINGKVGARSKVVVVGRGRP